jgi:tRNA 5-methylaminomethyl-2-thiouridine biosynthesis bifunctional protein
MAGACMVRALAVAAARKEAHETSPDKNAVDGLRITAFEAASRPATGASGNPVGIVHPFISKDWNLASQFMQAGVETTLRWVHELGGVSQSPATKHDWAGITGVLQLAEDHDEAAAWQALAPKKQPELAWLTPADIAHQFALPHAPIGGLWSDQAGWIKPAELVKACLADAKRLMGDRLTTVFETKLDQATLNQLQEEFDAVVVCTAHDDLLPWAGLRINKIAGQVSWVGRVKEPAGANESIEAEEHEPVSPAALAALAPLSDLWPRTVVCRSGYLTPIIDTQILVGATFDRDPPSVDSTALQPTDQAHADNLQRVAEISPILAEQLKPFWTQARDLDESCGLKGRVAIRHASHDRMPHVGRVISKEALNKGLPRNASQLHHLPREDQLYVLAGLGSRGLSIAPLAAEVLAGQILGTGLKPSGPSGSGESREPGEPAHQSTLPTRLLDAVDPARFILRAHRRAG